jgi:HTH-type transcriptional regulator / antitoxin HigA
MQTPTTYKTPGQLINALLEARGWTKRVMAVVLGMDETAVNRLASDKRPVTAEIALTLEEIFGVPAEQFLELQRSYDLAMARITARPDPGRSTRAHLFNDLPISEMMKRGWLDATDIKDVPAVEASLVKFFGAASVNDIEILPHAAKKTHVSIEATPAQLAWLYRVKEIASEMLVTKFTPASARAAIDKLVPLLSAAEEARKVPRILAESGIRFVIVEGLPAAKIDGACFWIDANSPVIGMTMRFDRIDNFWFVLRHELEHVALGHGKTSAVLDAELEGARAGTGDDVSEDERAANEAGAEFCVPRKKLEGFIARKAPFFAERDIIGFARTLGVHPGLVAGQLQRTTGRYDRFRDHLVHIRSIVAPGAIVDGWGNIAPVGQEVQ